MQNMLSGIPNQVNISDDILVGGSPADHDEALGKVLHTLHENGITVNVKKCLFDVEELGCVGLILNKDRIKPDPKLLQISARQLLSKPEQS